MDGTDEDLNSEVMKNVIDNNLLKNVYKNGEWGCYHHLPLLPGNYDNEKYTPHLFINTKRESKISEKFRGI